MPVSLFSFSVTLPRPGVASFWLSVGRELWGSASLHGDPFQRVLLAEEFFSFPLQKSFFKKRFDSGGRFS